jgi:hypothetical protein
MPLPQNKWKDQDGYLKQNALLQKKLPGHFLDYEIEKLRAATLPRTVTTTGWFTLVHLLKLF